LSERKTTYIQNKKNFREKKERTYNQAKSFLPPRQTSRFRYKAEFANIHINGESFGSILGGSEKIFMHISGKIYNPPEPYSPSFYIHISQFFFTKTATLSPHVCVKRTFCEML